MVSKRTSTGMKDKIHKGDIATLETYIKLKGYGTKFLNKCKAKIHSNRSATCIKDGRPLKKINKRWIYKVK